MTAQTLDLIEWLLDLFEESETDDLNHHQNGKVVFLVGPSGAGKTTLGENLKSHFGFLHFEGDQWSYGGDPLQDSAKGVIAENLDKRPPDMVKIVDIATKDAYPSLFRGETVSILKWTPFYKMMVRDIERVRAQHRGRDMVISHSVYPRIVRNYLRRKLGNELIVIILNTKNELLLQRIFDRDEKVAMELGMTHKERLGTFGITEDEYRKMVEGRLNGFEAMQSNEHSNVFQIDVDESMSAEDVMKETVKILGL